MDKRRIFIGIDEVGRGPIAGPLCICAFATKRIPSRLKLKVESIKLKEKLPLRDSKKLSRKQREEWFAILKGWQKEGIVDFSISYIHAKTIDKIGLSLSIKKALSRSLYKVVENSDIPLSTFDFQLLLDGGLKAPEEFTRQKTIIKGDEKEPVISFASIVAKVHRDRLMARHSKKFPEYGFESHVGYGTKKHYEALKKHGLTPLHRRSFLKNFST
jgi:ribonuclease HII